MQSIAGLVNALSPFSQIEYLEFPEFTGFICTPAEAQGGVGWGFPIYPLDEDGNPDPTKGRIFPGTPGGPDAATLLAKRKPRGLPTQFKEVKDRVHQSVASIDWWGPKQVLTNPSADAPRWIITVHGPLSRHFPDPQFTYGESSTHKEIYCGGGLVGIAPGPVYGAALVAMTAPQKEKNPGKTYYLMAVVGVDGKEYLYRKPFGAPVVKSTMTAEAETALSQMQGDNETINPGWLMLGPAAALEEYDKGTTPWFFSEDGTSASCIRMKDFTFDPGTGDNVTEKIRHLFTMTIAGGAGATTVNHLNDEPYQFKEEGGLTVLPDWTSEADFWGRNHIWEEMQLKSRATMDGTQIVAVDYIGNTKIPIRLTAAVEHGYLKDYMKGKDPPQGSWPADGAPATQTNRTAASGYTDWYYYNNLDIGVVEPNGPGGHQARIWFYVVIGTRLTFTVADQDYSQYLEVLEAIETDPISNTLYESTFVQAYPRYFDIRNKLFLGKITSEIVSWDPDQRSFNQQKAEGWSQTMDQDLAFTHTDFATSVDRFKALVDATIPNDPLRFGREVDWDAVVALTDEEKAPWSWSFKTYRGNRPRLNNDHSLGKYSSVLCLNNLRVNEIYGWKCMDMLDHFDYTLESGFASHPSGSWVASMFVPDPDTVDQAPALFTVYNGEQDLNALAGGARLYPLGST